MKIIEFRVDGVYEEYSHIVPLSAAIDYLGISKNVIPKGSFLRPVTVKAIPGDFGTTYSIHEMEVANGLQEQKNVCARR